MWVAVEDARERRTRGPVADRLRGGAGGGGRGGDGWGGPGRGGGDRVPARRGRAGPFPGLVAGQGGGVAVAAEVSVSGRGDRLPARGGGAAGSGLEGHRGAGPV